MKNNIYIMMIAFILVSCGNNNKQVAQADELQFTEDVTDTANAPIVTIESETFSFGKVKEGEKVVHEYVFTNTGKTPLIINDVQASCGCTTPNYPKSPVQPGEEAVIEVVFDTSNQPGMQHKVITMVSNAHPSQTQFHLKGEVIK